MKKPLELSLYKLKEAYQRLEEGAAAAHTELDQDGVIQRFEFTFELLWKSLKIFFEDVGQGLEARSPKDCLRAAFRYGFIQADEEKIYLQMLEDRNISSHVYDKGQASVIFEHIRKAYLPAIKTLIARLEKKGQE